MKKSDETIISEEATGSAERHPCLLADFDERLAVARKQREKVLAERAAAASVEAPVPPVKKPGSPAWGTLTTQNMPRSETLSGPGATTSRPGPYRNPKSRVKDTQKDPQPIKRRWQWIIGATLVGILAGGLITLILFERRSTYEVDKVDIVSRAGPQPDVPWSPPLDPTIWETFILPDRSPGRAVPQTDMSTGKSTPSITTLRLPLDTSPTQTKVWSAQPLTPRPLVRLNMPDLAASPFGTDVDVVLSPVGELPSLVRAEPMQQSQNSVADGMPSVGPDSLAPTLVTWDVVLTAPHQDKPGQARPLFAEWPDHGMSYPALKWPARPDDFDCQECRTTTLPTLPTQDQTVILFVSDTSSTQQKNTMMSRLSSLGLAQVKSHQIRLGASETNVRYFHDADAAAARAVARSAKARLVDLSELRPLPPVGTIELRLGPDRSDITSSIQFHADMKG